MIVYARVIKNLITEVNVGFPTTKDTYYDFWIEYDTDIVKYAISDIYYKSNTQYSNWTITSMDNSPITFNASIVPTKG